MKDGELVPLAPSQAFELELPKAGAWIRRPRKSHWLLTTALAGPIAFQLPNVIRTIVKEIYGDLVGWIVLGAILTLILGLTFWFAIRQRYLGAFDKALTDGSFGDQFPAEVIIGTGGKQLGSDRGVIWFDDGLMGFSGSAASFVLAASDLIPPPSSKKKKVKRPQNLPPAAIGLRGAADGSYVLVLPLGKEAKKYKERFRQFIEADARPEGERFWPPLEPYVSGPPALE